MKVLLISIFHPELVRGGAQQVCYELFKGLKSRAGIEPVLLAAVDPSFKALYKSGAQITGFDGRDGEFLYLSRDYDYLWHKVSSHALARSFAEFLELVQPDVVHFHHFLLLGIDLLTLTRRVLPNARIVFTFHEFLSICDAHGHMLRPFDNSLCTLASPVRCHQCFPERPPEHYFVREMWF
jgi:glycosyltransferase involved in cell wall biosynthesis